jgi:glycosyltransferase involved in cell wall biosynthesis
MTDPKLKILFGAPAHVYLDGPGGIVNQMFATKRALEKRGHQVDLFDPWKTECISSYDVFHLFFASADTYEIGRRVQAMGPKLVVSPIIDKLMSPRWISTANMLTKRIPKHFTHLSKAADLCQMADLTISRSADETLMLNVSLGVDTRNIAVVHNGVDPKFAEADPAQFQSLHGTDRFLLAVGLVGFPEKNFLRLIKIVNRLKINTFIIGPIQNTKYAHACVAEANKGNSVKILGSVSEAVLISSYSAAQTLILPSQVEGTGLVGLEAGLAGTNVAITKNGGPPDYFGEFAHYVDPTSDQSIESAIELTMKREKTSELRDHILANFTWDNVVAPLERAYSTVVDY